jgi:hypothetical protein
MLTFSHTLSFAFLHLTGPPGTMLGKGDNEDGKGKSNECKGMAYSEQLFLTHSFCPLTSSQYHARQVVSGLVGSGWNVGSGQVELGPVWLLGHWVGSLGLVGSSPVRSLGWVIGLGRVIRLGCWVGSSGSSEGDGEYATIQTTQMCRWKLVAPCLDLILNSS